MLACHIIASLKSAAVTTNGKMFAGGAHRYRDDDRKKMPADGGQEVYFLGGESRGDPYIMLQRVRQIQWPFVMSDMLVRYI